MMRKKSMLCSIILVAALTSVYAFVNASVPQQTAGITHMPYVVKFATPTLDPSGNVLVKSSRGYRDPSGAFSAFGEVINQSTNTAYSVIVTLKLYNSSGQLLATTSKPTLLPAIFPMETSPLLIGVAETPPDTDTYNLSVTYSTSSPNEYRNATVLSAQLVNLADEKVVGDIRNDTGGVLQSVVVTITFYDANNKVLYTNYNDPASTTLSPGGVSAYSIPTEVAGLNYTRFVVRAQGQSM